MRAEENEKNAADGRDIQILIAADIHFLAESLSDNGPALISLLKRADGKVTQYSGRIADAFIAQACAMKPDLVLLPGDLTFNGELESHKDLARRLEALSNAGIAAAVIPGNHDLYNSSARAFSGQDMQVTETASAEDFHEIFREFGYEKALFSDPSSLGYVYPLSEDIWLICVDVNTKEAPGRLTQETFEWAEEVLQEAKERGISVISVTHQNLLGHNALFTDGFRIGGADRLEQVYRENGVKLNLSGHMHLQHVSEKEGITDIATSALTVTPYHYGMLVLHSDGSYDYEAVPLQVPLSSKEEESLRQELEALKAEAASGEEQQEEGKDLMRVYGETWFDLCSSNTMNKELESSALDREEKIRLTGETALLNRAYFTGHLGSFREEHDIRGLLKRWQRVSPMGFMQIYMISILKETGGDMTSYHGFYR